MKKLLQLSLLSTGLAFGLMASGTALAQGACSVNFQTENNWGAGAQYKVTLTNTSAAKTSWELCWTYAGSDTVSQLWEGTYTQTGKNVCVKNVGYNGNLATNASVAFGLIATNPGAIPTAFTLNGASCGGGASSASSSSQSSISSISSSSSSTPAVAARWLLDGANSTFHFTTVKKSTAGVETPENFTFTQLQGTVATNGQATLSIPLASISTGVDIRNTRMQSLLFESSYLPSLHFTTQLDLTAIDAMAAGSTRVQSVTGNLVLHGIVKSVVFDALVVKHANNRVSFSPRKPIVINSTDFDLNAGVEALRAVAGLSTVGEKVPVYFKLLLSRDNPTNVPAISLATAPNAATGLSGTVSNATGAANLNWADVSANETGFLVRRKLAGTTGQWATLTNAAANSVSFNDSLTATGSYDYKVISYTDSIPAAATAPITVIYEGLGSSASSASSTSVTSVSSSSKSATSVSSGSSSSAGPLVGNAANGATLWTQKGCVGCHGVDGEKNANGTVVLNPLNPNRSVYRHTNDNRDLALRDFIATWMPLGNEGSCTGQCAADLEAYLFSWRRPSDGVPDKPATAFSCPSTAPNYGQRTLRLLTKAEYQRSVRDLVNYQPDLLASLPDDFISGAFVNNNTVQIDKSRYSSYLSNAERIAANVATRWSAVLGCTPSTTNTTCADKLVSDLAPKVFRRPLTPTEVTTYTGLARGTTGARTQAEGMELAVAVMLSSPQFLYRSEVGTLSSGNVYKLDGYEMATYLSYTLTGSTPNAALLTAAANGTLNTVAGIRQQAATLLSAANTKLLLSDFVNRWLATESLPTQSKDGIANFAQLAKDMELELGKNFSTAMLDSTATFATIYNPTYTNINQRLATHYGLPFTGTQDADGFVRANTSDRGGILVSGAFMSRYATPADANLITRAVAVRRKLLCQDIPEPPAGVSLDREALAKRDAVFFNDPKTTQRMIADRITAGTTCSNCHAEIINPLGGGMENFDAAGRIRSVDLKGNPVVTSATFFSPYQQLQFLNDPDRVIHSPVISFSGAKDLARTIAEHPLVSQQAQTCLATQFVSYSSGINSLFLIDKDPSRLVGSVEIPAAEKTGYRCEINNLTSVLNTRGPRAMLEELPALNSVIYRQEWAR
jgi:polyisoprenoid-binding protein YceI/cytochrome c553